jgi:GDP-fucose transporter C1
MAASDSMYIASVVGTYWVVSISMVYLNKVLMSNEGISIPAPLFVTWFQCVVTVLICYLAGLCGERARNSTSSGRYAPVSVNESGESKASSDTPKPGFFAQFPKAEYLVGNAKQVFPLTLIFGEHQFT